MHRLHVGTVQDARRIHDRIDIAKPWRPVGGGGILGEIARYDIDARKSSREILHAPDGADRVMTGGEQFGHDMPADKSSRAHDQDAQESTPDKTSADKP